MDVYIGFDSAWTDSFDRHIAEQGFHADDLSGSVAHCVPTEGPLPRPSETSLIPDAIKFPRALER